MPIVMSGEPLLQKADGLRGTADKPGLTLSWYDSNLHPRPQLNHAVVG